jgi:hypothetical protein
MELRERLVAGLRRQLVEDEARAGAVEAPRGERVPLGDALRIADAGWRIAASRSRYGDGSSPWTSGTPAATSSPARPPAPQPTSSTRRQPARRRAMSRRAARARPSIIASNART